MLYRHVFDKFSSEFRGILHVFVNFAGFHSFTCFTWISRLCDRAKYQNPCYYELCHLHYTNWRQKICIWQLYFSSWSPISSPGSWKVLLPWMNFKTGHFVLHFEGNFVEFLEGQFFHQKLSLSTKRKLSILLNFPFPSVSEWCIFISEMRNFSKSKLFFKKLLNF